MATDANLHEIEVRPEEEKVQETPSPHKPTSIVATTPIPQEPGWFQEGKEWYYLKENQTLQTGWLEWPEGVNDWYYLDEESGVLQTGWILVDGYDYYADPEADGVILTNTTKWIEDGEYTFDSEGRVIGYNEK